MTDNRTPGFDWPAHVINRMLVVDDNQDAADMLVMLCELHGAVTRVAYSGSRGLAVARAFAPHVILCDIGLPDISGYDFARSVRSEGSGRERCTLIAVSGYAQEEDKASAQSAGFDAHVTKPFEVEQLFREIARHAPGP